MIEIKAIVCIDDRGGYLFNGRRVSSDRAVADDILSFLGESCLWIAPYTAKLFLGRENKKIYVEETYLQHADTYDYCMIEEKVDTNVWINSEEIVLYKWNRVYPYDTVCPLSEIYKHFRLIASEEFKGYSHEKISKEVYSR